MNALRSLREPLRPLRFNFYRKDARGMRRERKEVITNIKARCGNVNTKNGKLCPIEVYMNA